MIEQENTYRFESRFTDLLPVDKERRNFCRQVHGSVASFVDPQTVPAPKLIGYSKEVAELLEIRNEDLVSEPWVETLTGNRTLPGMTPYAMCYGGHQFGHWAGQLGDGRAINLGERVTSSGDRYVMQLKGAGVTPYSRNADGLAVLRSSVREFLCSEAMHHLGVPTTRALSLTLTGSSVVRDMFYDGNPQREPGAIVCRVAPTFLRFGNYEIFASRQDNEMLIQLLEFTIREYFPEIKMSGTQAIVDWFEIVCQRTADLMVRWMQVGFVHGVMNTDNMSILGLTIDYGPYGWLEDFDPNWTPNTTDAGGRRYAYGQQPQIALWNLVQLANAIWPVAQEEIALRKCLENYSGRFQQGWNEMMAAKLGLQKYRPETDERLIDDLQRVLQLAETDMTIFYRRLAAVNWNAMPIDKRIHDDASNDALLRSDAYSTILDDALKDAYYDDRQLTIETRTSIAKWLQRYHERLAIEDLDDSVRKSGMDRVNPLYVLRNYLAQQAIDAAESGNYEGIAELLDVLREPYTERSGLENFAKKRPEWARNRPGCSMLSCSS